MAFTHSGNIAQTVNTVNDILELRVYCSYQDQVSVNVRHFQVIEVVGGGVTFDQILTYYEGFFHTVMKALIHNGAFFRGISIQRVGPLPKTASAYSADDDGGGEGGADPLPSQVSGIISFRSALAGKAFRGRFYVPFPADDANDADDTPVAAYVTALNNLGDVVTGVDEYGGGGNTVQATSVIFHRELLSGTPFIQWIAKKLWATQRRRGNFGRPNTSPV